MENRFHSLDSTSWRSRSRTGIINKLFHRTELPQSWKSTCSVYSFDLITIATEGFVSVARKWYSVFHAIHPYRESAFVIPCPYVSSVCSCLCFPLCGLVFCSSACLHSADPHRLTVDAPQSHEMGASEALISIVTDPPLDILTGRHDGSHFETSCTVQPL